MFTQIRKPNQHFNAYYYDDQILIQFIISELILTNELAWQIKKLADTGLQSIQALRESAHSLFHKVNQLLGSASDNERLSTSRWEKGPLTKLKNYCEQLSRNHLHQNKNSINLYNYTHQAWLMALHNLELLSILQCSMTNLFILLTIKKDLSHLNRCLKKVIKQIPYILSLYKDNENVLFFLLKKRDILAKIYGSHFIDTFFESSTRVEDTLDFLIQRYMKRGFTDIIPLIHQISLNRQVYS